MPVEIYEDRNSQQYTNMAKGNLNDEEQKARGQYYAKMYSMRDSEVKGIADKLDWDIIEQYYACDRSPDPDDPAYPNNFIPLITPTVEGQAAHMTTSETEINFVSDNPAHAKYMTKLEAAFAYTMRQGRFMLQMKDAIRSYLTLGGMWLTVEWEKCYGQTSDKPNGYGKVCTIPIRDVLVDGRIKDYKDLQQAEYIIHKIGFVPIAWARKKYGDELADALMSNNSDYNGVNADVADDDSQSFMLLHVWTRNNEQGNLQLIEMDEGGLILAESDPSKPFYEYVGNEYPFTFSRAIPILGSFYGYGDGKILLPMQKAVNNLTDELELAARFSAQSRLFVDPKAAVDVEDITSDPSRVIDATNPRNNIYEQRAQGINPIVQQMIDYLLREAQRATRFSDIMTGAKQTATESATATHNRVVQSSVGINDKKADIVEAMRWAAKYSIKLALEKWSAPFWSRLLSKDESEFLDAELMRTAPKAIPMSPERLSSYAENNPNMKERDFPTFDIDEIDGDIVVADIDFDVDIVLGTDMPHGKNDMFNIILALGQMQVIENGQPVPVISASRFRELIEKYVGIPITDDDADDMLANANQINPLGANGNPNMPQGSQTPLPSNLMGTVPGTTNTDKRGMMM